MQLEPGSQLGRYRVVSSVGSGGMGEVCRAEDTKLERGMAREMCGMWGGFTAILTGESERLVRAFEQAVEDLGYSLPAVHGLLGTAPH